MFGFCCDGFGIAEVMLTFVIRDAILLFVASGNCVFVKCMEATCCICLIIIVPAEKFKQKLI